MAFTERGLARWREVLQRHVEEVPDIVAAIQKDGALHVEALGGARRDSVFRISSLTKPITAVATLLLVEECRLRLDDSVEPWLPELANRRVLKDVSGPLAGATAPAARAITVRDLLVQRMGFGQFLAYPEQTPILRVLIDELNGFGPPQPQKTPAPELYMKRLAALPWMAEPGGRWLYNTPYDVLGVLIARATGQTFERFLEARIFAPLGMKDTGFCARERLVTAYERRDGALHVFDPPTGQFSEPPAFASGAGGLVSTADDLLAFTRALAAGKLLSRASRELMTSDHMTPEQHATDGLMPNDFAAVGYGFGVSVVTRREGLENLGTYGWDGGMGSSWRTDARAGLTGVLLTQVNWTQPVPPKVQQDFWTAAYAAAD
jgi:CubicO group peptidase (beta-lactamase class C family)